VSSRNFLAEVAEEEAMTVGFVTVGAVTLEGGVVTHLVVCAAAIQGAKVAIYQGFAEDLVLGVENVGVCFVLGLNYPEYYCVLASCCSVKPAGCSISSIRSRWQPL
jgi:hypothetical protein